MSAWRELATRLVADASVISASLQPGAPMPTPGEAAEFLRGAHHLIVELTKASIGIGRAYGRSLPEDTLREFRLAVQHMHAVSLDQVATALERVPPVTQ
jgi:hypothetical protein